MAIIRDRRIMPMHGSVGELTYREVNGRTVVSKKVTTRKSNTEKQRVHCRSFARLTWITTELGPHIETGFSGLTYNIRRRAFMKANNDLLNFMKQNIHSLEGNLPLSCLLKVLGSPLFLGNIYASVGTVNSSCAFYWDEDGYPAGKIRLSLPFEETDNVKLIMVMRYETTGEELTLVKSCTFTAGACMPGTMEEPHTLAFDAGSIPQVKNLVRLSEKAVLKDACMAAVVHRQDTCSTACFSMVEG